MNTIMSSVDRSQYGQASGLAASMRVFGQIISMSIVTFLFSLFFGNRSIEAVPHEVLKAMRLGFMIFSLIGIPGIYFSYFREMLRVRKITVWNAAFHSNSCDKICSNKKVAFIFLETPAEFYR